MHQMTLIQINNSSIFGTYAVRHRKIRGAFEGLVIFSYSSTDSQGTNFESLKCPSKSLICSTGE